MHNIFKVFRVDLTIIFSTFLILTACGGAPESNIQGSGGDLSVYHGSVGDGPIIGAKISVYDKNNTSKNQKKNKD